MTLLALETILKTTVMEAENAVAKAVEAIKSAADTTRSHSKSLKVAMETVDEVLPIL